MYNGNAVYNFEAFEDKSRKQKTKIYNLPDINSRKIAKNKQKLKAYLGCFSVVLSLGCAIGGLLFGQAKLVEYNSKISATTCELEEIKSRNQQLEIKLGAFCNSKENLKDDKCVEIITVASGDRAEIK